MTKSFYITTAIDYPNGAPHIGHTLEKVSADVVARYHRLLGDDTRPEEGKRYSWGYPACPDLTHRELVVQLLGASSIGVNLTDGYQFDPEQSTAAIVVHHPSAKYYAMLRTGGDE